MKVFKIFFVLALLMSQLKIWAQGGFIEVSSDAIGTLTSEQYSKYSTVTSQRLHGSDYLVTVGDLATLQSDGEIEFELPEKDCVVKARSNRVRYFDNDNYSWSAYVVPNGDEECECEEGSITILKRQGRYIGHLSIDDDDYVLEDLGAGKQVLVKLDFSQEELFYCGEGGQSVQQRPGDLHVESRDGDNCPVTVLALYTANGSSAVSDIESTIELAVEKTNTAYQRSQVGFELQLVGIDSVAFTESSMGIVFDVDSLANDSTIAGLRDDSNADVVVLFTDGSYGTTIGIVAAIGPSDSLAYAIVEAGESSGTYVFPHEVGHLFGCRHETEADPTGPIEHAHKIKLGLLDCFKRRRTIMWSNASEKQIQNFSNPQVNYSGKATGVWGERYNAWQLNSTNCDLASFRFDDEVLLTGYISGPFAVCIGEEVPVQANVSGGATGTYDYDWSYSYDGFSYTSLSSNSPNVFVPGINLPPTASGSYPIYIRVVVADQNGNTVTLFKSVEATNEDMGQDPPCSHHPIPLIGQGNSSTVTVYPNPVTDRLTLDMTDGKEVGTVYVFDSKGKSVLTASNSATLDISTLPPGIYFIKLQGDKEVQTSKFIKQ